MEDASVEWRAFERRVAALFRDAGADAVHDAWVAGSQVDVFVTELTRTRGVLRTVVDCKDYRNPVGVNQVREFYELSRGLIASSHAERALMVSPNGYTKQAREAAQSWKILLWEIADLEQVVRQSPKAVSEQARRIAASAASVCRVVREQLRSAEPLTTFDFDGLHNDLTKVLDDLQRADGLYPPSTRLTAPQRRVASVLSRIEDDLERAADALSYWRRLATEAEGRQHGFPDQQLTADATSARLILLREQEQARHMLRNRLRAVEDACARVPWNSSLG